MAPNSVFRYFVAQGSCSSPTPEDLTSAERISPAPLFVSSSLGLLTGPLSQPPLKLSVALCLCPVRWLVLNIHPGLAHQPFPDAPFRSSQANLGNLKPEMGLGL